MIFKTRTLNLKATPVLFNMFRFLIVFVLFTLVKDSFAQLDSLKNVLISTPQEQQIPLLIMISQQYLESDLPASEKYAEMALTASERTNNQLHIASAFKLLGLSNLKQKEYLKASEYFLQTIHHLEISGNDRAEEAKIHKYLGICYESMEMIHKALEQYEAALYIFRELNDPSSEAWMYHSIGIAHRHLNDNKTSYTYYQKAMHIFDSLNDRNGMESLSFGLALIYYDWGWLEKSLDMYFKALNILESEKDSSAIGFVYSNIAGIYENYLDKKKCYEYNYMALDIFKRINHSEGKAYIYNNLGMTFFHDKKFDSAIVYFEKSLESRETPDLKQQDAFVLNNMGEVYLMKRDYQLAKNYFDRSLSLSEKINDDLCLVTNWLSIGKYFMFTDEPDQAILYLNKASEKAVKLGNLDFQNQAYQQLSDAYKKKGEIDQALRYFQLHSYVKDSLFRDKSQKAIAEMNARYETELKEEHISRLNSENKLKSLELSQSKTAIPLQKSLTAK